MIKLARILKKNDDNVLLKIEQNSQCNGCKTGCSDGFLRFLFHKKDSGIISVGLTKKSFKTSHLDDNAQFFAKNHQENDVIGIKFDDSYMLKLAWLLYGIPMLLIVALLLIGTILFPIINISADLGGLMGLILGLVISKFVIKLNHGKIKPKVNFFN